MKKKANLYALFMLLAYVGLFLITKELIPNSIVTYIISLPILLLIVIIQFLPDWVQYVIVFIVAILIWYIFKLIFSWLIKIQRK